MGFASTLIKDSYAKSRELNGCKLVYCRGALGIAEFFRLINKFLVINGSLMTGFGAYLDVAANTEYAVYSDYWGTIYVESEESHGKRICMTRLVALTIFLVGLGVLVAASVCWGISLLFVALSGALCIPDAAAAPKNAEDIESGESAENEKVEDTSPGTPEEAEVLPVTDNSTRNSASRRSLFK